MLSVLYPELTGSETKVVLSRGLGRDGTSGVGNALFRNALPAFP
jgi:hypothetical protein